MKVRGFRKLREGRLTSEVRGTLKVVLTCALAYSVVSFTSVQAHDAASSHIDEYRIQLLSDADNHELRKKYIHVLQATQHYEEALAQLTVLRNQIPEDTSLDFEGAFINLEKGDLRQANILVDSFLLNKPNDKRGLSISGRLKLTLKKYDAAIKVLEHAISLSPQPDLYLYLADAFTALGELESAIKTLESGNTHFGNLPLFLNKIAANYEELGNYEKAIETVERVINAIGVNSRTEHYLVQKADLLLVLGQYEPAKQLYEQADRQLKSRSLKIRTIAKSQQLASKIERKISSYKNK